MQPGDYLQAMKIEAGPYRSEITEWDSKPSKSGKGINHFVTFTITVEGKVKGKELRCCISTAMDEAKLLGSLQFMPKGAVALIDAAVNNTPIDINKTSIDTDTLMRRPLDIIVGVATTAEGGLANPITAFAVAGSGAAVPF